MEYECLSSTCSDNHLRPTNVTIPRREIDGRHKEEDTPPKKTGRFVLDPAESVMAEERKYDPIKIIPGEVDSDMLVQALRDRGVTVEEETWTPPKIRQKDEMTDEELWRTTDEYYHGKIEFGTVDKDEFAKLRNYYRKLHESEGFDIDEMPRIGVPRGSIRKDNCCGERWPESYKNYMDLAQVAIDETLGKDNFKVSEVESVNAVWCYAVLYFITFTAVDVVKAGGKKTFQARVRTWSYRENKTKIFKTVEICRLKG